MVQRWKYVDPSDASSYTFAVNPNAMTSPFSSRVLDISSVTAVDGQPLVTEGLRPPKDWEYSGVLLDKAQLDAMNLWMTKRRRIYVIDHYLRRFTVQLLQFDPKPGKTTVLYPYRHEYTVRALVFKAEVETATGSGIYTAYAA